VSHRRAKLTVSGRTLLIERIINQGWSVPVAAEAQGVSVATAYKWVRRFRAEGEAGLVDRSSRPHRSPRQIDPGRELAILELRRRARIGPHRIAWALGEPRSTVYAVLRRHHVPPLAHLDRPTGAPVRYQRRRPGELVHVDTKRQGRIPDGGGWRVQGTKNKEAMHRAHLTRYHRGRHGYDFLHIAIDDCTRVAYVEVHDDELRVTAQAFTDRAIAFFGSLGVRVERVMTDNGSCYRRPFTEFLAHRGIRHVRTRPYRPQTNGKVERFNHTINAEWAYAAPFTSNHQRLQTLPAWLHAYNYHRPHTALGGGSPMDLMNNVPGNHS
jgi:transposase InsO family protein